MKIVALFGCIIALSLGGCSGLLSAGPMASELAAQGQTGNEVLFDVVPVDEHVVATLLAQPKESFHARFEKNANPPELKIAVFGDHLGECGWRLFAPELPPLSPGSRPSVEPLAPASPPTAPESPPTAPVAPACRGGAGLQDLQRVEQCHWIVHYRHRDLPLRQLLKPPGGISVRAHRSCRRGTERDPRGRDN
jgi:hypothetical protein